MNKQKLSQVQRQKKEEKRNSAPFLNKRRERNQTKESMGEGGKELMNAGILTLHCSGISRSKQASRTKTDYCAKTQKKRASSSKAHGERCHMIKMQFLLSPDLGKRRES